MGLETRPSRYVYRLQTELSDAIFIRLMGKPAAELVSARLEDPFLLGIVFIKWV